MELSNLQEEILTQSEDKSVIIAAAAAGKTKILTEKVRQLLRNGVDPRQIAVITFTNMAASELQSRLGNDYRDGIYIGTVHGLAYRFLVSKGVKVDKIIKDEQFDKLFEMVEYHPECVQHYEWVLLDEAQDSDPNQFIFLFELINPDHFFVVGDEKQSIYRWRGASPKLIRNLAAREDVSNFELNENYRNASSILSYAKNLISPTKMIDTSVPKRGELGMVVEKEYSLPMIFNYLEKTEHYGDWAILTRTNDELNTIAAFLAQHGIPVDTFKQSQLTKEELAEKMSQDTVKILTVHAAKGLEWNKVIVVGMRYKSVEDRCVAYVAATRARDFLVWTHYPSKKKNEIFRWA